MPPKPLAAVPRGTFASHSRHLQQRCPANRRFASDLVTPISDTKRLWTRQNFEIMSKVGESISGGQEWQTSTYCYNKQNIKNLPTAATNVEKLIENYVTMKEVNNEGKDPRAIRTALAARRKSAEKVYVSKPRVKDFGTKIELTAFVFDGKEAARDASNKRQQQRGFARQAPHSSSRKSESDLMLNPEQQKGLQFLIARIYGKPVDLRLIKLNKPHLDADILARVVAQRLRDRRNTPRRVIRDATWRSPLPNAQAVADIRQAKYQRQPPKFTWNDFTFGNTNSTASDILEKVAISQVSSVEVEAAGRLTKRLTANRSQRKMARRGATAKEIGSGYMLRGFRKAHTQYGFAGGKRRVGQFGIRVNLGHA